MSLGEVEGSGEVFWGCLLEGRGGKKGQGGEGGTDREHSQFGEVESWWLEWRGMRECSRWYNCG